MKPGDPKSEEQAKKDLEKWADKIDPNWRSGDGASGTSKGTPLEDDPRSRLRTHETQLQTLKDALGDKERFKAAGLGEEDAKRLVDNMEKVVELDKQDVADWLKDPKAFEAKRATIRVSGGDKVTAGSPDATGPKAAGSATAPAGYAEAQKRFAERTGNKPKSPDQK
jgi:hypothetical protein